jgi:hypothetical protein
MTKKFHIERLIKLGLWSKECARVAELLGKEQALTARHRIKPTSPRCHSAWQPNFGRHSTYRGGNSVQTTGVTSLMLRGRYAIQRFENLKRNPLDMREAAPLLRKALKRAEASRREAQKTNEGQLEKTNKRKRAAHSIISDLIKKDPYLRLPRKQTRLANDIRAHWPKHDKAPAISTLRHWLAEMRLKK